MTSAELPRCPTCGVQFVGATACRGYCSPACWPEAVDERRAEQHEPTPAKGAQQPPSPHARTDAASGRTRDRNRKPARRGRSERFAALNAFVDFGIADAKLTPAEALVWLVLFRDTKANGLARTGQTDIARRAGLSVRGVKKAIRALNAKGMVHVLNRGRLNVGPSVYRVHPTRHMG
jgi:hypothetical protein